MRPLLLATCCAPLLLACPKPSGASESSQAPSVIDATSAKNTAPDSSDVRPQAPAKAAGPLATLEGRVTLEGSAPTLAPLATNESVASTCGEQLEDPSLRLGEDGGLAGVVVALEHPADGQTGPFPELVVDQKGCLYTPTSVAARAGATVVLVNSDPLLHNVRGSLKAPGGNRSVFNVAMPLEGMKVKKTLPTSAGIVELRCDVHPWMHAVVKTFDHPYFAVTDAKGRFKLENVPAGSRKVSFWHPRLAPLSREVVLSQDTDNSIEVSWPATAVSAEPMARGN